VLGLSGLYNSSGSFDVTKLVNVAHNLLRKCQQSSRYREELESRCTQYFYSDAKYIVDTF